MNKELRKKAEKKVNAKMAFYTCGVVFSCVAVILVLLSFHLPAIASWLLLPLPVLVMVMGVLYLDAFGLPFTDTPSENWREEEIEKEMKRLIRREESQNPPADNSFVPETLELKKPERLPASNGEEDYV